MSTPRTFAQWLVSAAIAFLAITAANAPRARAQTPPPPRLDRAGGPFTRFDLPDDWEERFWADPDVKALLELEPKALADLVPTQAGLRFCRCPACLPDESEDTLRWSPAKPEIVTCRSCGESVPSEKYPAKSGSPAAVPEETVEVLPRVIHKYPYHLVDPLKQAYPDERLYLAAKRDYEAREYLARSALYAAVRYHEQTLDARDPALARLAAVLVLRFAQVYPAYATHFDQPRQPKYLQQANLKPPYRRGYRTGKWDWTGCLDVPMNLVIAYALIRDDPAIAEAGRLLDDPNPSRTIENDLFRAAARFTRLQPEEYSEPSIYAYRGLLAVGRLLDDPKLVHEALRRLDGFAERGFYHDGLWRQGDPRTHRRVVGLIDGWIDRLLSGRTDLSPNAPGALGRIAAQPGDEALPIIALAREAGAAALVERPAPEVQQAAWPAPRPEAGTRHPMLLGGAGLARLAVGQGADALDLELRGLGDHDRGHSHRLTLRLAVGGHPVLGDLDGQAASGRGFERATVSHNAVAVDGLNQRETLAQSSQPAPGSEILFFAADPDFQVATFDDRFAYPTSTTRYRQTVLACAGPRSRFAVAVFEVRGGLQHDQFFHAPAGSATRWRLSARSVAGPATLLPPMIPFVPTAEAEDGRWFVQSLGEFSGLASSRLDRPSMAVLADGRSPGVRLHLLGDMPAWAIYGVTPDPTAPTPDDPSKPTGRAALVLRRRSDDGSTLQTTFVTVFEPIGGGAELKRVGRVASPEGTIVLALETVEGPEHLVLNLRPGTSQTVELLDGRTLRTDGLAVRALPDRLLLAGGTFAETDGLRAEQTRASGTIKATGRGSAEGSMARGWFETVEPLPDPSGVAGRALIVRHGDGTSRGWTILDARNRPSGGALIEVREVPGFRIDPASGEAAYYQFPRTWNPGPHAFLICQIARSGPAPLPAP